MNRAIGFILLAAFSSKINAGIVGGISEGEKEQVIHSLCGWLPQRSMAEPKELRTSCPEVDGFIISSKVYFAEKSGVLISQDFYKENTPNVEFSKRFSSRLTDHLNFISKKTGFKLREVSRAGVYGIPRKDLYGDEKPVFLITRVFIAKNEFLEGGRIYAIFEGKSSVSDSFDPHLYNFMTLEFLSDSEIQDKLDVIANTVANEIFYKDIIGSEE